MSANNTTGDPSHPVQDQPVQNELNTIEIPDLSGPSSNNNFSYKQAGPSASIGLDALENQHLSSPRSSTQSSPQGQLYNNNNDDDDGYGMQPMAFKLGNPPSQELEPKTPMNQSEPQFPSTIIEQRKASLATKQRNLSPNYALNIMVRQFTKYAERKLNLCLNSVPLDREPNIIDLLSEGVDPTFDKIISSLGYIARRKPKSVTDAVMHWRRGKSELREMARSILEKDMILWKSLKSKEKGHTHKKSASRSSKSTQDSMIMSKEYEDATQQQKLRVQNSEITFTQADRQFTISTYILWRVLIEVVRQTPNSTLIEETGLEEIMYNYLKNIDPFLVSQSLIHSSNWNLLAELLGHMSEKSFLSVSDRFIGDLEKFPSGFTDGTGVNESSLNLLIHGMRYLQFSNASLERFEEGADFMKSIAKFFYQCENESILISYCDVINQLLLSLAGSLTAEVNHPTWVDAIRIIYTKSLNISLQKPPKYWKSAATLVSTSLSVAPKTLFEQQWLKIVDLNIKRLKPKLPPYEKIVITTCLARSIWAYLYRYSDTLNAKTRNLEMIANQLFQNQQNKKQQWITHDSLLIQATVQILRSMAYSQLNFTLENIVLPIMKSSFNGVSLENFSHEKMTLCIRAYSCILSDYESQERPPFPTDDVIHSSLDPMEFSNEGNKEIFDSHSSNAAVHDEVSNIFNNLLFLLDNQVGCKTLDLNTNGSSVASTSSANSSSSSTPTLPLKLSSYFHTEDNSSKNIELFSTVISSVTWCVNNNSAQYRKIIELLVKNCIHEDDNVSNFSLETLKILMTKKNPNVIMTTFARTAFYLDEKTASFLNHEYLSSIEYIKLVEAYVDLLQCWLESLTETSKESAETPNEMYNVNRGFVQEEIQETKTFEELELKNIVTIIDEVEGNGLFFLFSHDFRVRFLGSQILRIVAQFDEVIYDLTNNDENSDRIVEEEFKKAHNRMPSKLVAEFGTRIIQVLESLDYFEFINPKKAVLSEAESKRFTRLQHKQRKDTIIRLAESNHGVDAALWFKIFEEILDQLVKRCPIQIAIARSHSCIRLVQLYDQIVTTSNDSNSGKVNSLIWDYMLYLKIACSSLTSTSEQRLHIPNLTTSTQALSLYSPLTKTHNRKRSQQLFTVQHQKITSAKSIFKMVVPLLTTSNNKLKDALVEGLSCLNVNIFKSFLQSIDVIMDNWKKDIDSQRVASISETRLRVEVTGILNKVVAKFSKSEVSFVDEVILSKLQIILENILHLLVLPSSHSNFEFQRLRKYFCGLLETFHYEVTASNQVEAWLPFKFRKQSFEFMEQWCGYGKNTTVFNQRYRTMMENAASKDDSVALQASLELQKRQLQYSAISCMSSLCSSPIAIQGDSFGIPQVLSWIDSLFNTYNDKIHSLARKALLDILTVNTECDEVVDEVIKKCYTHDPALGNYFLTLSEAFAKGATFKYSVYRPLALGLFSSGSDNINVRTAASNLLEYTEMKFYNTNNCVKFVDGICCRSRVIYKRTLFQLSTQFATLHPEEKFRMISELTMLFHVVGSSPRRDILAVLLPWVQTVELDLTPGHPNRENSLMVLINFFEITVKFSHKIQNEVEALWVALGNGANGANVKEIYQFIVDHSLELKNLAFLECSRQVIVSLSTIPGGVSLVDTLLNNLEPKSMIPVDKRITAAEDKPDTKETAPVENGKVEENPDHVDVELPYVAELSKIVQNSELITTPAFSLCELSVIFLVDLLLTPSESVKSKLPLLLHLSVVLLDHQLAIVQEQACAMLTHLIHQYGDPEEEHFKKIVDSLRGADYQKHLWLHSDVISDKNGGRIPENMDSMIRNVLSVFEKPIPGIQQDWSRCALMWATSCKVMHIASRSFQVFRCLISFLDLGMLRDMLSCLANTVSDENPGIQSFSMQILMTLNAITAELYSEQLIDFPQLFWSVIACLNTIHEAEFIEVVSTLSKFISKIDLDSEDTVKCLIATFPPKWEGRFDGLQFIVMIGLRSSNAYEPSLKLLDRLNMLNDSEIIGSGDSRILMALMANMPRFLNAQVTKRFSEEVINAANVLCTMADKANIPALSRIITSLVKKRFRNKEDLLNQVVSVVKRQFFPKYAAPTPIFLLGLLFNKTSWIKVETMDLLKHIFRVVDLKSEEFVGLGADLVSPLLRLLMTDHVDQALEVLDEATSISASPLDKHYLMMSAGDSTMRKEYEKIATLFGIPDESGWSIPMPAVSTARTRNNIHSVFSTCVLTSTNEGGEQDTELPPQPEFNRDDYVQYNPLSAEQQEQFNRQLQQQNYISQQQMIMPDGASVDEQDSLSHMLATLENLDSFFTKDTMDLPDSYGHQYNGSVDTRSTAATSTTENQNWNLNFDSPNLDQSMQFSPTTSFKTLLGESNVSSPSNPSTSSFRNSAKLGKRRSSIGNIVESMQLSSKSSSDHHHHHPELSPLGSPMVGSNGFNGSNVGVGGNNSSGNGGNMGVGEESDGLFRFEILRPSSKIKKRPNRLSSPIIVSNNGDGSPLARTAARTPRTPRTPKTPRSPYSKNSRFSRTYTSNYKRSTRVYSPTRENNNDQDTDV